MIAARMADKDGKIQLLLGFERREVEKMFGDIMVLDLDERLNLGDVRTKIVLFITAEEDEAELIRLASAGIGDRTEIHDSRTGLTLKPEGGRPGECAECATNPSSDPVVRRRVHALYHDEAPDGSYFASLIQKILKALSKPEE